MNTRGWIGGVVILGVLAGQPGSVHAATVTPVDAARSCADIYNEITMLLKRKDGLGNSFFSSRYNNAAAYAASTFTDFIVYPSAAYLGIATVVYYYKHSRVPGVRERIENLRAVSAAKLCFVK